MTEDAQSPSVGNSDQAENAPVTPRLPTRRIWLCADDYGISPGVSEAIRELIARGRLNATSAMVVAPSFGPSAALQFSNRMAGKTGVAIGLHLTMTAPFRPLTAFTPVTKDGTFPPISDMLVRAFWPRFDRALVAREVEAQIDAFVAAFARPPDFVDGHHHVHLLPRIGEAVLAAIKRVNPAAWVRQCRQVTPLAARLHDRKGIVIDLLSRRFRAQAKTFGVATNPAFAGTYRFQPDATFAGFFPSFLDGLPGGSVVMCHPGFVDAELERLDSLTTLREKEFAFLASDELPALLAARGFSLA
ncbi:MAG: ChbG/HpnK family deacetylase [Rhodoplanes sp.]